MSEGKGSGKSKKYITGITCTIIAPLAGIIAAIPAANSKLKLISLSVMYISIIVLIVIIVFYIVGLLEKLNGKKFIEVITETLGYVTEFKIAADDIFKKMEILNHSIEDFNQVNIKIENSFKKFEKEIQNRYCPVRTSSYADNAEEVNSALLDLLKKREKEIKELHIICFGRQGFGGIVSYVIGKKIDVKVKIIVFNPQSNEDICRSGDDIKIRGNIKDWLKDTDNIEIIVSNIPPMVRAAVVYSSDKNGTLRPIWGSVQSYRFGLDFATKKISLEKPVHSLISICEDSKTVTGDLHMLVNCFEEEFRRLENNSQIAELVSDKTGAVVVKLRERSL